MTVRDWVTTRGAATVMVPIGCRLHTPRPSWTMCPKWDPLDAVSFHQLLTTDENEREDACFFPGMIMRWVTGGLVSLLIVSVPSWV